LAAGLFCQGLAAGLFWGCKCFTFCFVHWGMQGIGSFLIIRADILGENCGEGEVVVVVVVEMEV
jgi:hypothetical protein